MINACLIGKKLGHSYSPTIHSYFGYPYKNVELAEDQIEDFLKNGEFDCFNVTVPYKKTVMPYLELSDLAKQLGAVNTIVKKNGKLYGYNTDYYGFAKLIEHNNVNPNGKKVVILGTGGASAVCQAYMKNKGANVVVVGRNSPNNYDNLYLNYDAQIIVNATPVGMYPNNLQTPVDLNNFKNCEFVADLIYNPFKTALLLQAEQLGIKCENGLSMLVYQAIKAAYFFTGEDFSNKFDEIYNALSIKARSIMLIGMPSCGKSTVGKALAKKMDRPFFDLDNEIVKQENMDIPSIFSQKGEGYFRVVENNLLNELSKKSDCVISLGGGAIMHKNAFNQIKQNSIVVYLTREKISTKGRPLLKNNGLDAYNELKRIRQPIYQSLADITLENNTTIDEVVNNIMGVLNENHCY